MPIDTQAAQTALETALNADIGSLLLVVVLVMALAFIAVIMVFNRTVKNSGGASKGANDVIRELAVHLGAAVDNNTQAMQSIRDVQIMTLTAAQEVKSDTGVIRADAETMQTRLHEIKSKLDTMEVELAAVRVGVDSMLKGRET